MEDPGIRRSWLAFATTFFVLGLIAVLRLSLEGTRNVDWAITALIVIVGFAAVRHRVAVQALEAGRRAEAESFTRILQGLSRSVSADAIVAAIVEELGTGTGADHVVIVRRRPDARVLEATLVNTRTGGSTSSTLFPIGDLEDPPEVFAGTQGRDPVAIPIEIGGPVGRLPLAAATAVAVDGPVVATVSSAGNRRIDAAARRGGRRAQAIAATPAADLVAGGRPSRSHAPDLDLLVAERIAGRARAVFGLRHTLVAPLTTDGGMIGALLVSRRTAGDWPDSAQRLLAGAAIESSAALSRAYSHRQAEARAATDALTGLPNRRYFDEFCALLARRRRAEDGVGVLMVDIDKFKGLNDRHGHQVGDEVLRAVAGAIVSAVREDDVPARYGGEEFAVLLRNPTRPVAVEVGERVREAVGALDLRRWGIAGVSVSVGVAVADDPNATIETLIQQADHALYDAKRRGRDRVVAA
ncbi:MAG TPA: GGDEF domain-containing protein [Candidatus Limnocylindrales bacterium]|nr:GGDEF domain-containing protein [Candidatus Limnocylindrales bacterium]